MATLTTDAVLHHPRVRGRAEALVLEVVLWVLMVGTFVSGVIRPLLGWGVVGWLTGGRGGQIPFVDVTLNAATLQAGVPPTLPSLGAGEIGPGAVEMSPSGNATVFLWNPTPRQLAAASGQSVIEGLVVTILLLLAIFAVRDLRRGQLFTTRNLRRTYAAAFVVAVGGMVAQAVEVWGRIGVLDDPQVAPYVDSDWTFTWMPLIAGLAIFAAAEVVRQGVRMRRDVEGLV